VSAFTTWLLDGNVLLALTIPTHAEHKRAREWHTKMVKCLATCPITQGTLLRVSPRYLQGTRPEDAMRLLLKIIDLPEHEFWPDDIGYDTVPMAHLQGQNQLTDAYLAALARHRGGKVATFDVAFAKLYPDDVELIP
jgi:toxin-antitoxin system PIN domain toxin